MWKLYSLLDNSVLNTIIRSVIVNTVESTKTWGQNNLDFTVFLNRRITIFGKLNIYNLFRDWPQTVHLPNSMSRQFFLSNQNNSL